MKIKWPVRTSSPEESELLGEKVGAQLQGGEVFILSGELGSGKTTFIRGLARGLGVHDPLDVSSPSYTIINEYKGEIDLIHVDLYRLYNDQEIVDLALEDLLGERSVMAIEWGERLPMDLGPSNRLSFRITGDQTREIALE